MQDFLIEWCDADKRIAALKVEADEIDQRIKAAQNDVKLAIKKIQDEMSITGEYEVLIEGEYSDYKIYTTKGRGKIVVDADAVPDEFCKIEKTPILKKIGELLDGENPPNWARLEPTEGKLSYKVLKKGQK